MKSKHLFEILEEAGKKRKNADKIAVLQENDCTALRNVLRGANDATIEWMLPKGTPPFDVATDPKPSNIHDMATVMGQWTTFGGKNLNAMRREQSFIDVLKRIHPKDAELLIDMKDKTLTIKGISVKIINEAFPGMIQEAM